MKSFIPKTCFALALLLSFSAHADLQQSLIAPQLAYENSANQQIEIVDFDSARDFEAVKNIAKEGWATLVPGKPYDEEKVRKQFLENISFNRPGQKTIIKVARVNGQTAGYMTFVHCVDGNNTHYGMVEHLAVESQFRNKGIGYKLLSTAQDLAQKNNGQGLVLFVLNVNTPAINLYEKFGFGLRADYDSDEIALMAKYFNTPQEPSPTQIPATPTLA
jgi:ribosomal protein S18 acetylase RimI-like enzyme